MTSRLIPGLSAALLLAVALSGCAAPASPGPAPTEPVVASPSETPEPEPVTPDLTTADTALGEIVVDSFGLTVYYYDRDTAGSGVSTCSGNCLVAWPPVHPISAGDPVLDGVTGGVGVITGTDGKPQLTLNGLPLYYFRDDTAPGDVTGQAAGGVWWVVAPDGSKITG